MGRRPGGLLERPGVAPKTSSPRPVPATLTVKQVARVLDVSEQTVRRAVERGEIEAVRMGAKIQILRKELCEKYKLPLDYDFGPS